MDLNKSHLETLIFGFSSLYEYSPTPSIGGRPRISQELVDRIQVLNGQGLSMRKIGKEINVHLRTVAQYLDRK